MAGQRPKALAMINGPGLPLWLPAIPTAQAVNQFEPWASKEQIAPIYPTIVVAY